MLLAALASLPLTGCVVGKYQAAPKNTPAAIKLNLPSSAPAEPPAGDLAGAPRAAGGSAVVTTVVTFRGPGSWKRDAYWDEYTLTIANPGQAALTVESAVLTDRYGELVAAGGEPWTLEKQSRTYQQHHLSTTGEALKIGGGAIASSAAGLLGGAAIGAMIGNPAGWVIVPTWAAGAGIAAIAAVPVFAGVTVYKNVSSKREVEAEFERRRIVLPATVAPGADVSGSLFFRITPGPQALVLQCRVADEPRSIVIDLAPLAALHLPAAVARERLTSQP